MRDSGYQRFLAELKRRHVFRVMAVYGVVGFILLQVVDLAVPALLLPDWTYRLVAFLLLLGFPVAIGLAWAFETTPEGLRLHQKADPDELRAIIAAPASRRWPAGLLALGGVALVVWAAWHAGRSSIAGTLSVPDSERGAAATGAPSGAATASIAVLPFVNMSADPDQEYFSDGISEELLNLLAGIPALKVSARTSSFAFKGKDVGIPQIARQLGVDHVLEGSVRKSGDQVRITAQLIRAEDGFHLWSKNWDRTLEDIFAIQDEIADDVAGELQVTLLGSAPKTESADPRAYNLVLQARHLLKTGSPESLERSGALFREALSIDSTYPAAWAGLSRQIFRLTVTGVLTQADGAEQAAAAAERALAVDPGYAEAYAMLGDIALLQGNDPSTASRHFERALELDPTSHEVLGAAAQLLRDIGRYEEALAVHDFIADRDPVNPSVFGLRGTIHRLLGRYDTAIGLFRTQLTLNPATISTRYELGLTLLLKGEFEAAIAAVEAEPDEEYRVKITTIALRELGREAEHLATFRELREKWGERWPSEIAQVYAWKGEADAAFEWLDRAIAQNEEGLDQQHMHPYYDPIRDDPRWLEFLERTGTSPAQLTAIEFEVPLPE